MTAVSDLTPTEEMTMTPTTTTVAAPARTFTIDRAHSDIGFQVRHLLSKVRGRFTDFDGSIEFDAEQPEKSSVRLTIQAASIDTGEPARDQHLRSADFFGIDEFPALTFESSALTRTGETSYDVLGTLTIHGVSQPVVVPVAFLGQARDPWGHDKLFFEAELTINRKDFGLNWNAAIETGGFLVGDEVKVAISIQAQ
jgi:polyisoprenoid-binding protein YceI